jgi:putative solute:sodium symporter small subunit
MSDSGKVDTDDVYHHEGQGNPAQPSAHDADVLSEDRASAYWRANLKLVGTLLTIWFAVSYGAGVVFVDTLDTFTFMGFPLGFWFAQQGAIYVFVVLIFVYVGAMHRIDRAHGVDDDDRVDGPGDAS